MDPPRPRPAPGRGGPARRVPPSRPPRQREPGGPPRADQRTLPGWPSLYRNASGVYLVFDGHRRCARILDSAVEDQVDAVMGDGSVGHEQGPGELADAKVPYGLDTASKDLGGHADYQPVDQPGLQERGDHPSSPSTNTE